MILPDTNVWSELTKPSGNPKVKAWIADHTPELWLSTIVIAEIRYGIERPEASAKRRQLEQWLADLETAYGERIVAFDSSAAHAFGWLVAQRKARKQESKLLDLQIAAQGIAHDMTIATRNTADFVSTGARLIDPWTL